MGLRAETILTVLAFYFSTGSVETRLQSDQIFPQNKAQIYTF